MLTKSVKGLLSRFLTYTEQEVLNSFASLQGAVITKEFVYVPGSRDDRILLVAHADTVNQRSNKTEDPPHLMWMGDVVGLRKFWHEDKPNKNVYSAEGYAWNTQALGADDRAGCAMLWNFKDSGHSLLITTGEESGLSGARAAVRQIRSELTEHCFALEVDRRGDRQAVFYDVGTEAFKQYVLSLLTASDPEQEEWLEYNGSSTDIKHICDEVRICGVNVAAGYLGEHGQSEMLFVEAWLHTHDALKKFLAAEHPVFLLPAKKVYAAPTGLPDRLQWRWCPEHSQYMDKCQHLHPEYQKPEKSGAHEITSLNSRIGKQFKVRIFRLNGEGPGEGTMQLRLAVAGNKDVLGECPQKLSKRQAKKLAKVITHLLSQNKMNNNEATMLLAEVIRLRDVKPQDVKITEEQRADAAAGIHPQEKSSSSHPRERNGRCPHGYLMYPCPTCDEPSSKRTMCRHGVYLGCYCRDCPGTKASLLIVFDGDHTGEDQAAQMALAIVDGAAKRNAAPQQEVSLVELAKAQASPSTVSGIYDALTGRCWHSCGSCKRRWYHDMGKNKKSTNLCRLSFGCLCPTDGSPTVLHTINHADWGYISDVRKQLGVEIGSKVGDRVSCGHRCHVCGGPWKHVKPKSGKCDVGGYDTACPIHSRKTYEVVEKYEGICKLPGWASCLHRQYKASEDPNDASSNEPAKGDISNSPLLMDGKTGSGLKVDSQREGELN